MAGKTAFFGEIGLTGELRHISQTDKRIAECARMGVERIVLPATNVREINEPDGVELIGVKTLGDALALAFT